MYCTLMFIVKREFSLHVIISFAYLPILLAINHELSLEIIDWQRFSSNIIY